MQTRVDAEIVVFIQKRVVSQNIRNAKVQSQGKKIIKLESDNQEPGNQNADKTDKG